MIACVLGAAIICIDIPVRQIHRWRNFSISESDAFLSASLSLSFGVMVRHLPTPNRNSADIGPVVLGPVFNAPAVQEVLQGRGLLASRSILSSDWTIPRRSGGHPDPFARLTSLYSVACGGL